MATTNPIPAYLKPLEEILKAKVECDGKTCTISGPGGVKATLDINEAKAAALSLVAITKLVQPAVAQARFAKAASDVVLANAEKFAHGIIKLALPENVKSDLLGGLFKRSIEALVPDNRG